MKMYIRKHLSDEVGQSSNKEKQITTRGMKKKTRGTDERLEVDLNSTIFHQKKNKKKIRS